MPDQSKRTINAEERPNQSPEFQKERPKNDEDYN